METRTETIKLKAFGEVREFEASIIGEGENKKFIINNQFAAKCGRNGSKTWKVSGIIWASWKNEDGTYSMKRKDVHILNKTGIIFGFWKTEYNNNQSQHNTTTIL